MSSIRSDDFLRTLPSVLKNDDRFRTLASVAAKQLRMIVDDIRLDTIYARIDALPEELLDILAYDFKVDWWDYSYTIEQKRQTLKDSFMVHRHLGTKFAVETAISAIYPETTVQEWFEYGGDPYTFRLAIDATDVEVTSEKHKRVLALVDYYKNLRSHLDGIDYSIHPEPAKVAAGAKTGGILMRSVAYTREVAHPQFFVSASIGAKTSGAYMRSTVYTEKVSNQQVYLSEIMADTETGTQKVFALYIDNGRLTMAEAENSVRGRDKVTLIDHTAQKVFALYVNNGKLTMSDAETGVRGSEKITLMDRTKKKTHILYLNNCKLTMEEMSKEESE